MLLEQKPKLPQTKEEIDEAKMEFCCAQLDNHATIKTTTVELNINSIKTCMGYVHIKFLDYSILTHDVVKIFGKDLFEITPYIAGNYGVSVGPIINNDCNGLMNPDTLKKMLNWRQR